MKINNKVKNCIVYFAVLICAFAFSVTVYAETKQKAIVTLDEAQDLVVVFTYDKEVVDIAFISPSGTTYTDGDDKVDVGIGELWKSYKISNAEAGTWKVEYDLKGNTGIDYSVVDSSSGIWVDKFEEGSTQGDNITFNICATTEEDITRYNYEIYAVNEDGMSEDIKIADGSTGMDAEETCTVDLSSLSSGSYTFRLEIWAMDGGMEVFDAATIEGYDYVNANAPATIEDFKVLINESGQEVTVRWDEWAQWSHGGYYLKIVDDSNTPIFDGELLSEVKEITATFPEDITGLTVYLRYQNNGIWSSNKVKTVKIGAEESLALEENNITSKSQAKLVYATTAQRTMYVEVNTNKHSEYMIDGEGYLGLTLEQGENTIYAAFPSEDNIFYCVDQTIYYDAYPPEIILYEKLDGKTLQDSSVHIIGKINYGNTLTVNGEQATLEEDGSFDIEYSLSAGENVVTLTASDENGNQAVKALTIYRDTGILAISSEGLKSYIPLACSLAVSIAIILLSFVFIRKRNRNNEEQADAGKGKTKKKHGFLKLVILELITISITVAAAVQFVIRYKTVNSIAFLAMAETSVTKAAEYIRWRNRFGIATIVGAVISIIVIPLLMKLIRKKSKKVS